MYVGLKMSFSFMKMGIRDIRPRLKKLVSNWENCRDKEIALEPTENMIFFRKYRNNFVFKKTSGEVYT